MTTRTVPAYCYNCVAGPDLLTVKVTDGVAVEIGPNFAGLGQHPSDGKPCVKAYGLIQKTYHPQRIRTPMKRTNPRKGRSEDPRFVPISWDELDEQGMSSSRFSVKTLPARLARLAADPWAGFDEARVPLPKARAAKKTAARS